MKIREVFKIVEHNKDWKMKLCNDINNIYRYYMTEASAKVPQNTDSEIIFPDTGSCNLKYDKRKE